MDLDFIIIVINFSKFLNVFKYYYLESFIFVIMGIP